MVNQRHISEETFIGNELKDVCTYHTDDNSPKIILDGHNRFGAPIHISIGEQLLSRHLLLLGGIGTGKSNAFDILINLIRPTLSQNDLMIIFDTKGDYYKEFYQKGDIVISNDDKATDGNKPNYWNLVNEAMVDDRVDENILEISKAVFADKVNTTQPFFPNAARDLFGACITELVRNNDLKRFRNNYGLRCLIDTFTPQAMVGILDKYDDLKALKSYIADPKSGQTLGVVSELQQAAREILVGNFAKSGDLSMRQLVRNKGGKVVFIEYDLSLGSVLTPIYRLLIDLAIKEALCRKENEGNVYLFIDEFRLLPHLEHIDDGVNFGRSLGAKFFVGVQNIEQISAAYGQDMAQSILSGFGTTVSFRVNDKDSREYIKGLFGEKLKLQTYTSAVQSRGIVEEVRQGNVVEDYDITNLPLGQAIIGTPGCMPFRFQFDKY